MIHPFVLHRPESLSTALSLIADLKDETRVLAGGSELVLLFKMGLARSDHIIDIKRVAGLNRLEFDPFTNVLHVGPLVTHRLLEKSNVVKQHFPLMVEMERSLANVRIRNIGTLAGNLCFAEPHADPAALLLVYDAVVKLQNSARERRVRIGDFFTDYYQTVLEKDELMTEIEIPKVEANFRDTYARFCPGERPIVSAALLIAWKDGTCLEARFGLGCVGPKPIRVSECEEWLRGKSAEEIITRTDAIGTSAAKVIAAAKSSVEDFFSFLKT